MELAAPSREAYRLLRRRDAGGTWFLADWDEAVFLHWAVDPAALAPHVPFPLDTWRGEAYVGVVWFTQRRLRPRFAGALGEALMRPLGDHAFCNLRTYVRVGGERGICFLKEWIPNRLALLLGPATYGLPYRFGRLRADADAATTAHRLEAEGLRLAFRTDAGDGPGAAEAKPADPLGRAHFLTERYTAFVAGPRGGRGFRIWHRPWALRAVDVELDDVGLLAAHAPWLGGARFIGGLRSPGVADVRIGRPVPVMTGQTPASRGAGGG